jgi:hypothetical protein
MILSMAWRISDSVVDGELDNTVKGRVTGWIRLSGRPEPLALDLEGDCHPDLAGWRFRIVRLDPVPTWAEPVDLSGIFTEQVGHTGDITADQVLRHYDCPVGELLARIRAGEPPPTQYRKALYLEWFSQRDGRVVIQDTRLGVQRIGDRAFELTKEDLRRKDEEARHGIEGLREQGFVIEEDESGITIYRKKEHDDDTESEDLESYLDQQMQDIDRAVQDSLDDQRQGDGEEN